ncbi:hypothetical protein MBLNU457_g0545t1 [Dothideomycetes sp. NU457]
MTPAAAPKIEYATSNDLPTILTMIRAQAAHHDTPKIAATEETLRSTLSLAPSPNTPPTSPGYAKCLLLRAPKTPPITTTTNTLLSPPASPTSNSSSSSSSSDASILGLAIYYPTYSTFAACPGLKMEDLYIRPEYRGAGYGTLLIRALADEVRRMGGTSAWGEEDR